GHNIAKSIAWLSSIHTLLPGDIVATGTNHRGLNPFMDGDTIELETEGLGRLKFGIKDELKRTWARKTRLQMHEEAKEKTAGNYPDFTQQLTGKYAKYRPAFDTHGTALFRNEERRATPIDRCRPPPRPSPVATGEGDLQHMLQVGGGRHYRFAASSCAAS